VAAEVVGFRENRALLMPFGPVEGVAPGRRDPHPAAGLGRSTDQGLAGRIVDAFGEPIDGKGPLPQGIAAYPLRAPPPSPMPAPASASGWTWACGP
jgi:flagellum-specific ATP synthase